MDAAAGMYSPGLSCLHCCKNIHLHWSVRVTVQWCPAVSPAGTRSSAVMWLRKSSCVPPRGVTSPSVEADWGWEGWSCCYHDFTLQAMHRDSAGDRDDSDRLKCWHHPLVNINRAKCECETNFTEVIWPGRTGSSRGQAGKVLENVLLLGIKLEVFLKISVTLTAVPKVPVFYYCPQLSESLISSDS